MNDELFVVQQEDYEKLYSLADAIMETRPSMSHEYIAASALIECLDEAIESDKESVVFTEDEVNCISCLV